MGRGTAEQLTLLEQIIKLVNTYQCAEQEKLGEYLDIKTMDLMNKTEKLEGRTVECETLRKNLAARLAKQESKYLSRVHELEEQTRSLPSRPAVPIVPVASSVPTTESKPDVSDESSGDTPINSLPVVCQDKNVSTTTDTENGLNDEARGIDTVFNLSQAIRRGTEEQLTLLEQIIKLVNTFQDVERDELDENENVKTKDLMNNNKKLDDKTVLCQTPSKDLAASQARQKSKYQSQVHELEENT